MRHVLAASAIAASTLILCTACVGSSTSGGGASGTSTGTSTATGSTSTTSATGGGSTTGGGSSTTGTTTTAASSGTGGSSGGGSGGGSGSGSGTSACLTRYLNGSVTHEQGAAGSTYLDIVFKNLNNQACTLDGYPGVSFGAGTPVNQVGQPAQRNAQVSPTTVTLQPGGYAYAVLQIGGAENYPSATCQPTPTTYLQVYPPNSTNLLYIAFQSNACKGNIVTMYVQAVQPGDGS